MKIFHSYLISALIALPGLAVAAAPSVWQATQAQDAHALSIAGVRAVEIRFDPAFDPAQATELSFDLFGTSVMATRSDFQSRSGGWTWFGNIDGVAGHSVVLSQTDGQLAGRISTHTATYEIRPGHTGAAHLIELDSTAFPPCGGAVEPLVQPAAEVGELPTPDAISPTDPEGIIVHTIDVMIVYTPTLLVALGGEPQVRAQAQAAVDASNSSFQNSEMTARFQLVAVLPTTIDDGPATTSLSQHLSALAGNAQVAAWRNQYGADLVSMLVNDGLGSCGIGYVMRTVGAGFAVSGFQVTASSCAVGNLSYAHEHGHNMGMEHDPPNGTTPANASYPWSFGHVVDGSYRTVMAYSTACTMGCTRRQYFSNPNVFFLGAPTGVVDSEDNHRTGNLTAPVVAAFRANANLIFANGFD